MKILKPDSTLVIVLEYPPEVRFTPDGNRIASFRAIGMLDLSFQMYDNDDEGGAIDNLVNLYYDENYASTIEVQGSTRVVTFKSPRTGERIDRTVFTVKRWRKSF